MSKDRNMDASSMSILAQLSILFSFSFLGDILSKLLPFVLPASVISLLLLLIIVRMKVLIPEHIDDTASFLCNNMAFFFLPSAVSVLQHYTILQPVLGKLILICVVSTALTFAASYSMAALIGSLQKKRERIQ